VAPVAAVRVAGLKGGAVLPVREVEVVGLNDDCEVVAVEEGWVATGGALVEECEVVDELSSLR